jgi:hypothetical protein
MNEIFMKKSLILHFKQGLVHVWHGTELTSFLVYIQCDLRYEEDCNDWVTLKTNNNL